jgi:hypothetical protein
VAAPPVAHISRAVMPSVDNVILTFPPRPVSHWERALLAEWLAATQRNGLDVHRAFVSERRGDNPKILGRIVVVLRSSPDQPSFLVHSPAEFPFWVVMAAPAWEEVWRFPTLRAALNAIRPVLDEPGPTGGDFFSNLSEVDPHHLGRDGSDR